MLVLMLAVGVVIAAIPVQQRVLRHRAERLLVDIRSLKLRRSTWADAQQIFVTWGAWGHYEGTCSQQSCSYEINLGDFS